ncbi:unnamed protein product, partial [Nesidiocoris tenuis]
WTKLKFIRDCSLKIVFLEGSKWKYCNCPTIDNRKAELQQKFYFVHFYSESLL